jgi:hypothetical protein
MVAGWLRSLKSIGGQLVAISYARVVHRVLAAVGEAKRLKNGGQQGIYTLLFLKANPSLGTRVRLARRGRRGCPGMGVGGAQR